jgi:hypothetical protein
MVKNIRKECLGPDYQDYFIIVGNENGMEMFWSGPEGWCWADSSHYHGFPDRWPEEEADKIIPMLRKDFCKSENIRPEHLRENLWCLVCEIDGIGYIYNGQDGWVVDTPEERTMLDTELDYETIKVLGQELQKEVKNDEN